MRLHACLSIVLSLSLSVALLCPAHLGAASVRRMSLQEIVDTADRVFVGKCIDVRTGTDEHGLAVTHISFSVIEAIKGRYGRIVTIKTIGGGPGSLRLADMPVFTEGEEVLLFLYPESRYGFTSPVGLYQGKWTVETSPSGKKQLRPTLLGATAYRGIDGADNSSGRQNIRGLVDYASFVERIRNLVGR